VALKILRSIPNGTNRRRLPWAKWLVSGKPAGFHGVFVKPRLAVHFGEGIVRSATTLAPKVLRPRIRVGWDYLAGFFQDHQWDLKC